MKRHSAKVFSVDVVAGPDQLAREDASPSSPAGGGLPTPFAAPADDQRRDLTYLNVVRLLKAFLTRASEGQGQD
jgi:hypothetical protein